MTPKIDKVCPRDDLPGPNVIFEDFFMEVWLIPLVNTGPGKGHLKYLLLLATILQGMHIQYILLWTVSEKMSFGLWG